MILLFLALLLLAAAGTLASRRMLLDGKFRLKDFDAQRVLPLRGLLALFIIAHHLALYTSALKIPVVHEFDYWGTPVVSMFFFITGYGLTVSYRAKGRTYLDGFPAHRLGKLLPAFVLAHAGYVAAALLWHGDSLQSLFGGMAQGGTPLPNSWFIYTILLFYSLFYAAARTFRRPAHMQCALWVASSAYIVALHGMGWGGYWYVSIYALNVGMAYACCEDRVKALLLARPRLVAPAFGGMLALTAALVVLAHFWYPAKTVRYLLMPPIVVLGVYLLGSPRSAVLGFLGKISYEIYLVHGCFIIAFLPLKSRWPLYFLAVYATSVAAAWVLHAVCTSPRLFTHQQRNP